MIKRHYEVVLEDKSIVGYDLVNPTYVSSPTTLRRRVDVVIDPAYRPVIGPIALHAIREITQGGIDCLDSKGRAYQPVHC